MTMNISPDFELSEILENHTYAELLHAAELILIYLSNNEPIEPADLIAAIDRIEKEPDIHLAIYGTKQISEPLKWAIRHKIRRKLTDIGYNYEEAEMVKIYRLAAKVIKLTEDLPSL